jgi:hypothetical protein
MNVEFWSCPIPGLVPAPAAAAAAAAPGAPGAFMGVMGPLASTPQQAVTVPGVPLGASTTPALTQPGLSTTPALVQSGVPPPTAASAPASAPAGSPVTLTAPAPARATGAKSKSAAQGSGNSNRAAVLHSAQGGTRVITPAKGGALSMTVTPAPGAPQPQGPVNPSTTSRATHGSKRPRTDD